MKVFEIRKEGILGYVGWHKKTLLVFGVPLLSRLSQVLTYKGGGIYEILYTYKLFGKRQLASTTKPKTLFGLYHDWHFTKDMLEDPTLPSKVAALCDGLDAQSRATVARILSRIRTLYEQKQKTYTLLSQEEITELERIRTQFYPNVFQIAPDLYCYDGYLLSTRFFEISVLWHRHNLNAFSPRTLEAIKHKNIIDVGACVGDSSLVFGDFTTKSIYAFEPTSANYNHLLRTIALNNATRIIPVKKALGSKPNRMKISVNGGSSSLVFDNHTSLDDVEVITLDSFVREHDIEVGFIKVDIEGFEQEFLKGARETIATQKPAMLLSIYHNAEDFLSIKPMIESWNLGYRFKVIKPIDFSVMTETALYCEVLS